MSVGEFTASNIHMDEDKREEEKKKGAIDMAKMTADIAAQVEKAGQVAMYFCWRRATENATDHLPCTCRERRMRLSKVC